MREVESGLLGSFYADFFFSGGERENGGDDVSVA